MKYFKYGCWVCLRKLFDRKIDALKFSSKNNCAPVYFYYHNDIWSKFNIDSIRDFNLDNLYLLRAQQIRNKYSHLILHYSGGSDSHNILMTFLRNNIKLDEIVVKWAKPLLDKKFYTPNSVDTSASNSPSEWDYAIQPTLDFVSKNFPSIKITIQDISNNFNHQINSNNLIKRLEEISLSRFSLASSLTRLDKDTIQNTYYKKNTGHILGVEKPILIVKDGWINFLFSDIHKDGTFIDSAIDSENVEYFYWAPDLPELPITQALVLAKFFTQNKQYLDLLLKPGEQNFRLNAQNSDAQSKIIKNVLYPSTWDNRFQVDKPNLDRSDWWSWLYKSDELTNLRNLFNNSLKDYYNDIDESFLLKYNSSLLLKPCSTPSFKLLKLP